MHMDTRQNNSQAIHAYYDVDMLQTKHENIFNISSIILKAIRIFQHLKMKSISNILVKSSTLIGLSL